MSDKIIGNNQMLADLLIISNLMDKERINILEWELTEIPFPSVYCFSNKIRKESVDFELNEDGLLRPHFYKKQPNSIVTKHEAKTIKEAIQQYEM